MGEILVLGIEEGFVYLEDRPDWLDRDLAEYLHDEDHFRNLVTETKPELIPLSGENLDRTYYAHFKGCSLQCGDEYGEVWIEGDLFKIESVDDDGNTEEIWKGENDG